MHGDAERILAAVATGASDTAASDLLEQFYQGYPVEHLRQLLQSDQESVVKTGAWIASELGPAITPLIGEISHLLKHRSRYVRFFAIDGILAAAGPEHGKDLAAAVETIGDEDDAVRWKAMTFLARASLEQLEASIPYISSAVVADLTAWLIDTERGADLASVLAQLDGDKRISRKFGAAAAVRLAHYDPRALEHAGASIDQEVASFAHEWLSK